MPVTSIYLDTCTVSHVVKDRNLFIKLDPIKYTFSTANGTHLQAIGKGTIAIYSPNRVFIHNVYYCPRATKNLISSYDLFERGLQFNYEGKKPYTRGTITIEGEHLFDIELQGKVI